MIYQRNIKNDIFLKVSSTYFQKYIIDIKFRSVTKVKVLSFDL